MPQVLNWIDIWALGRPREATDLLGFAKGNGNLGTVWGRIVFLEPSIVLGEELAKRGKGILAEGFGVCLARHRAHQGHNGT